MAQGQQSQLRHSWWARLLRHGLYWLVVDRKSWPITFEPPVDLECFASIGSPHLYVHLPFCESLCHYCPYVRFQHDRAREQEYSESLLREIDDFIQNGPIKPVASLYFGGGSPSISLTLVERVVTLLLPHFTDSTEVAIELHPLHCDAELFDRLKRIGINKVSIGVESFSQSVLETLGRPYTVVQARRAIVAARDQGFECLDINLIYAIPGQTTQAVVSDVRTAISLGADHISVYPLFAFRHGRRGKSTRSRPEGIKSIRERILTQKRISELCMEHGYIRTSVWSFTRPGVKPYTTVTRESYRGFGVGAGSRIADRFWFNSFSLDHYVAAPIRPVLEMRSTPRLQRFHWLYWQIYQTEIDPARYRLLYGRNLERDFRWPLLAMRLLGWLERHGDRWQVTERGAIFAHLLQSLFSLSYIDILWSRCLSEPQPGKVVLE